MAEDEDYDLLPHKDIVRIKKELEELKQSKQTTEAKSVVNQINQLRNSINDLLDIFKEAQESFKLEEKEPPYIKDLLHKLEILSEQNTRIAEGVVAVADMIKELRSKEKTRTEKPLMPKPSFEPPKPSFRPSPPPYSPPPAFDIPPPPSFDIPPPPEFPGFEQERKKKGLFRFRK